ncbi:protein of unknown function [Methylocaldum szegediense]|uniref:Uncharacterized protein n=1 Tax=Methylocaldum szegediense TaxID=73780 RepID=A0ABN8X3S2_9GAMM|nr:protein of unknown function [Methylocaldum szegediense]
MRAETDPGMILIRLPGLWFKNKKNGGECEFAKSIT